MDAISVVLNAASAVVGAGAALVAFGRRVGSYESKIEVHEGRIGKLEKSMEFVAAIQAQLQELQTSVEQGFGAIGELVRKDVAKAEMATLQVGLQATIDRIAAVERRLDNGHK